MTELTFFDIEKLCFRGHKVLVDVFDEVKDALYLSLRVSLKVKLVLGEDVCWVLVGSPL